MTFRRDMSLMDVHPTGLEVQSLLEEGILGRMATIWRLLTAILSLVVMNGYVNPPAPKVNHNLTKYIDSLFDWRLHPRRWPRPDKSLFRSCHRSGPRIHRSPRIRRSYKSQCLQQHGPIHSPPRRWRWYFWRRGFGDNQGSSNASHV